MFLCETRRDFVNLQDRCRAEIVKRVKTYCDLEKIKLPPSIKKYLADSLHDQATPLTPVENYEIYMV